MIRYSASPEAFAQFVDTYAEMADPIARRSLLAQFVDGAAVTVSAKLATSPLTPTESALLDVCDLLPEGWTTLSAFGADGFLFIPTNAAEKSATTSAAKVAASQAERIAAVAADAAARFAAMKSARTLAAEAAIAATLAKADADAAKAEADAAKATAKATASA